MEEIINSKEYWERRFATKDWERNLGNAQTAYFYRILMRKLPQWIKTIIKENEYETVDLGCAEGDGVPILGAALGEKIKGVDFSESAITLARQRFPQYEFDVEDICSYGKTTDVSVLSNIAEHFCAPFALMEQIAGFTKKFLIVMVPLAEENLMDEHAFTFLYSNIPLSVADFQLVYFSEYDCMADTEGLFFGRQIVLIYSRDQAVNGSISIEQMGDMLVLQKYQEKSFKEFETNILSEVSQTRALENSILNEVSQTRALENSILNEVSQTRAIVTEGLAESAYIQSGLENVVSQSMQQLISMQAEQQSRLKAMETQYQSALEKAQEEQRRELQAQLGTFKEKQALQQNYDHLYNVYEGLHSQHLDLAARFNSLNDAYGALVGENAAIKQSRTYRIAQKERAIAYKLRLDKPMKFALAVRREGWKSACRRAKQSLVSKKVENAAIVTPVIYNGPTEKKGQELELYLLKQRYEACLQEAWSEISEEILYVLNTRNYKGILIYPYAVHWEPIQRPQHFLRSFAEEGYLCFFCEAPDLKEHLEEPFPNVFIVYGEEHLLHPMQSRCPIVMSTFHRQTIFIEMIPKKIVWFDLLDNLEFFAGGGDDIAQKIYQELIRNAQCVSYSADRLKSYLCERSNALLLNNAVNISDFSFNNEECYSIPELETIKQNGKKIIGYYGAIEEWFDIDAVNAILQETDYHVVLIGNVGVDLSSIRCERLHLMGPKPYMELKHYAKYFDIALIPFIVNGLTNSVSPVKFFEYAAQSIPVVSADIYEMRRFAGSYVKIYHNYEELLCALAELQRSDAAKTALQKIAQENTWKARTNHVLTALHKDPLSMRTLADFRCKAGVCIHTVTFFKYDGTTYYSGGAERYLLDLHEVCKELRLPCRIYQYGEYNWVRFYKDVEVTGLQAKELDVNQYCIPLIREMTRAFQRESSKQSLLDIYSPFYILGKTDPTQSLGISHGISWDSEFNSIKNETEFFERNRSIVDGAKLCDKMISVDTNTCNWFQTLDFDMGRKIRYVPNYVDPSEFHPCADVRENNDRIVIIYPRRLYAARGLYLVLEILDDILKAFPQVEFHFIGKGFDNDTKHVQKKIQRWGDRVKWYSKAPDEMHEVYQNADIALIPTIYSEGTSLSCLEAMSSGNAVIATRVGGLTDLIINGYNGLLIEPDSASLRTALCELLDDGEKMVALKRRARETAAAFSKEQWKKRWKETISAAIQGEEIIPYEAPRRCMITLGSEKRMRDKDVLDRIAEYLAKGWYVFVACRNNPMKHLSYKRLQFIDTGEDLYFTPEISASI